MNQDHQDRRQVEEHKTKPMINLGDSINRSQYGNLGELAKGSCLSRIITSVIIIGSILTLTLCSN